MSGQFEDAFFAGTQLDGHLTDDEFRDMSDMFDLDGASQALEDSQSRDVSGDYELPVLRRLEGERRESSSVALTTAAEIFSSDDDDDGASSQRASPNPK